MTTPDALRDAEYIADVSNIPYDDDGDDTLSGRTGSPASSRTKETQARVKMAYLNRLLRDFDVLIYCQLSVLYYMDCSIFHFFIRAIIQLLFFTPKSGAFPEAPKNQPYLVAMLISNFSCMLIHCVSVNPTAGYGTRGYLHGGLFIDFVGQKGPISKPQLLVVDFIIVILQIVMLGVVLEKEKTTLALPSSERMSTAPSDPVEDQDHDAEERGVFRSDDQPASDGNDIELQELRPSDAHNAMEEGDNERNELISGSTGEPGRDKHARDIFISGEAVIMEMSIVHILRDQWRHTPVASSPDPTTSTTSRDRARTFLRRQVGIHMGVNG